MPEIRWDPEAQDFVVFENGQWRGLGMTVIVPSQWAGELPILPDDIAAQVGWPQNVPVPLLESEEEGGLFGPGQSIFQQILGGLRNFATDGVGEDGGAAPSVSEGRPTWWPTELPWPPMTQATSPDGTVTDVFDTGFYTQVARIYGKPAEAGPTDLETRRQELQNTLLEQQVDPSARSIEELITRALSEGTDEGFEKAVAFDDFRKRPSPQQALDLALRYAASPADYLTLLAIARGEAPIQAQTGQFQRVAPPAQFLQNALSQLFGPDAFAQPGVGGEAVPVGAQREVFDQERAGFEGVDLEPRDITTDGSSDGAPRQFETKGVHATSLTGPRTLGGSAEAQAVSPAGMVTTGELSRLLKMVTSGPPSTPAPQRIPVEEEGVLNMAQGGIIEEPSTVFSNRTGLPTARIAENAPELVSPLAGPSVLPRAVKAVGLEGRALPPVPVQFPEMGSLRFPSAQAWQNMLPLERAFFRRSIELQGIRWEDYSQQFQRTSFGQGETGPRAQFRPRVFR